MLHSPRVLVQAPQHPSHLSQQQHPHNANTMRQNSYPTFAREQVNLKANTKAAPARCCCTMRLKTPKPKPTSKRPQQPHRAAARCVSKLPTGIRRSPTTHCSPSPLKPSQVQARTGRGKGEQASMRLSQPGKTPRKAKKHQDLF